MTSAALLSTQTAPKGMAMVGTTEEPAIEVDVVEKRLASPDIVTLTLRAASGEPLPAWLPGAHIDIVLPSGEPRQYSLCGAVDDLGTYRVGVLRDAASRGGSVYVHDELAEGDRITIRGPRNHFELEPSGSYLFIAGGIGITPLIAMADAAQRAGATFTLVYCARSRSAMAFLDELQARFGEHLLVNADDESGLFDLQAFLGGPRPETSVYACGPSPFLDATVSATASWPSGSVHFERFEALEFDASSDVEFEVELTASGTVLTVPADRSVLSVLSDNGVRVLSSCTEGTCGTCEVAVVGGDPIVHRDAVLSPEEQDSGEMMMVCVSRCAGGRLLLDL